jgi:hypothetical protein
MAILSLHRAKGWLHIGRRIAVMYLGNHRCCYRQDVAAPVALDAPETTEEAQRVADVPEVPRRDV